MVKKHLADAELVMTEVTLLFISLVFSSLSAAWIIYVSAHVIGGKTNNNNRKNGEKIPDQENTSINQLCGP